LKAGAETDTEVSEAGVEEGVLTAKGVEDVAEVGTDTGAEDYLLVVLGVAEDVDVDTGAETRIETLRAEEVLGTFSIEVEADVALEEVTEAAFVLPQVSLSMLSGWPHINLQGQSCVHDRIPVEELGASIAHIDVCVLCEFTKRNQS
jgi:hypothetical protein